MKKIILQVGFITLLCLEAHGFGSLKARSPGTNQDFVPLWLKLMDAKVVINDQIAITTIDQTFKNTSAQRKEGIYEFALPEAAVIIELALWINGQRCVAQAFEKTNAKSKYDNSVRKTVDPALLEKTGDNTYTLNVFPIEADGDSMSERRIDFTYAMALKKQNDTLQFPFQLKTTELSQTAPQRTSLTIQASFNDTIAAVSAPGFLPQEIGITQPSKTSFSLTYGNENAYCGKDLLLTVALPQTSISINAASYDAGIDTTFYFDSTGDPGYFMVRVNTPCAVNLSQKSRNLICVVDASYSMTGNKFLQVKKAIGSALRMLSVGDYFNVISFGTSATACNATLVAATGTNINSAVGFINALTPKGITNPLVALQTAFSTQWVSDSNRAVLFITDGYPTWPVRKTTSSLINTISSYNRGMARLYSVGIGADADEQFLSLLSQRNNGFCVMIQPDDTLFSQLGSVVQQMLFPLFTSIAMDFETLNAFETYPATPQTLIAGQQFNIYGRYSNKTDARVIFSAQNSGKTEKDTVSVSFPVQRHNNHAVPQLWAISKVNSILDKIRLQGGSSSLVQQIVALGLRYHIVTPYTSLLVLAAQSNNTLPIADNMNKRKVDKMTFSIACNPRSLKIRFDYSVPTAGALKNVSLKIYTAQGKLIKTLAVHQTAGGHFVVFWDKRADSGSFVGQGCLIAVLEVDNQRIVNTLRIVR